jgi:hypothetical protein
MNVYIENHENELVFIKDNKVSYTPSVPFSKDIEVTMGGISGGESYIKSTYFDLVSKTTTTKNTIIPLASQTNDGFMSALDKQKIDN